MVYGWWAGLEAEERRRSYGVVLCMALCLVHYALFSFWFIEDAAISFTYARHLADGEGLVAYPGGERVQGFSNPTWTFLLVCLGLLGLALFVTA